VVIVLKPWAAGLLARWKNRKSARAGDCYSGHGTTSLTQSRRGGCERSNDRTSATLISGETNLLPVYATAHVPGLVAWPEFARHVGACLSPKSDTGCGSAAAGVENPLRDGAGGRMPR